MKTTTKLPALLLIISMMFASSTFANKKSIDFEEEAYIDDIPFNTEWVVNELAILAINFEEEAYVDDIPFNTANVVANYNYNQTIAELYVMEDENYIDDIPFITEDVVEAIAHNNALTEVFEMADEAYVNDIPFDTYAIANDFSPDGHCVAMKK